LTTGKALRRHLGQRFFVRWHMSLILAGVVLSGVGASRALLALDVRSIPVRWLLVLVIAYGVFFLLVRLWIAYVAMAWPPVADTQPEPAPKRRSDGRSSWLDWLGIDLGGGAGSLEEGIFLFLFSLLLTLVIAVAALTVFFAPVLLAEAAFQALLASGLLPATRRLEAQGWAGSLLRATVAPFAVVAAITVGIAWLIQWRCPETVRLADVFTRCRQ
jgi:hypothetical protein